MNGVIGFLFFLNSLNQPVMAPGVKQFDSMLDCESEIAEAQAEFEKHKADPRFTGYTVKGVCIDGSEIK